MKTNTVYIADDNDTDRTILESALRKLGFEVVSFTTGDAICDAIRKADRPVIALVDWLMPGRNGVDICRELSANPPSSPVYSIIVTSRTDKTDIAFALDNGADDFVTKPFNIVELRARIHVGIRLLASRQQLFDSNGRLLEHTKNVEQLAATRAEQLVRADRLSTIGILSAGMAHEINNPTSFIAINIQTLEENLQTVSTALDYGATVEQKQEAGLFMAAVPEILGEMKNGIARIRSIVNGLKSYSHLTQEKHGYFAIDDCMETALHLCANRLKYHVTVEKMLGETPQVFGDQFQIEQVLVNIFTNAADAIEESGRDGVLTLSTECANGKVIAQIHDTGRGIPAAALEKVFMPFYTTKAIGKGTGLGLSISRTIITDHKGELLVENHAEGGALFTIILPSKHKAAI